MKFCVIGVGRFGYHVATTLADNGMEVLAVDSSESIIASIRDKVTQAICMRVTDEESLRSIGADAMDTIIVAMGENFAQSILVTAILKQRLKIKTVITRSISDMHREILQLIGADKVILPEREVGKRLADTLSLPFPVLVRLTADYCISEFEAPHQFIGLSVQELDLADTHHITLLGLKTYDNLNKEEIHPVDRDYIITARDMLVIAGTKKALARVIKL